MRHEYPSKHDVQDAAERIKEILIRFRLSDGVPLSGVNPNFICHDRDDAAREIAALALEYAELDGYGGCRLCGN